MKIILRSLILAVMIGALFGCSNSRPPEKEIDLAITKYFKSKLPYDLESYEIRNEYRKEIGGENWHIFDVKINWFIDSSLGKLERQSYVMLGLVKRGDKWYSKEGVE